MALYLLKMLFEDKKNHICLAVYMVEANTSSKLMHLRLSLYKFTLVISADALADIMNMEYSDCNVLVTLYS